MQKQEVKLSKNTVIPSHIAIIPDGNRRWARARGLHTFEGHRRGFNNAVSLARAARRWGIHTVTLWGFSTENWDRDKKEIEYLMKLYEKLVDDYLKEARRDNVRIVHLGRKDRIPAGLLYKINRAQEETVGNTKYIMNIGIDYGGHDELIRAIAKLVKSNVDPDKITKKIIEDQLDTHGQPYPYVDLLIRTSGEQRTSGLLPWQTEYAEMYWADCHFPDFGPEKLGEAILEFSRRRRRFGGNGKKVHKFEFKPRLVAHLELDWWRARELHENGKFREAFVKYFKEQFGISLSIAREATDIFLRGLLLGETEGDWKGTKRVLTRFYKFIKSNIKLAFEPDIVASLEVEYLQGSNGNREKRARLYETLTNLYAELFRIPLFQARSIARFRTLAHSEEELAQGSEGKTRKDHLKRAEEYLVSSYEALKERIA